MKTKNLLLLAAALLPALTLPARTLPAGIPDSQVPDNKQAAPKVDVCFVLDTTGSMTGLIEAAKQKIWHIANQMASRKPTPQIRFALIGYRDRGDAYVTQVNGLTDDLDSIYGALLQFRADGGGDGPESVNQALDEAVNKLAWDRAGSTKRVIFLVGDAPPHMDYQNDVPYMATCERAIQCGIIINSLQCGDMKGTATHWSAIAKLGGGQFHRIPQDGGARDIQTPQDADIQEVTRKLNTTVIPYGDARQQAAAVSKVSNAAVGGAEQQAARASCLSKNADGKVITGDDDLVDAVTRGALPLDKVQNEHLPAPLQKMDSAALKDLVTRNQAERADLQKRLAELGRQRDEFIVKAHSQKAGGEKSGFDATVGAMLDAQLQP